MALYYTKGMAHFPISFPEKKTQCRFCPLLSAQSDIKRYTCRATGEYILNPASERGDKCPIYFENEEI